MIAQGIVTEGGDSSEAPGGNRVEPGPKDAPDRQAISQETSK